ncbi:MAG TPA: anti-sigma factor [Candidatus Acidoferrales bacterium]
MPAMQCNDFRDHLLVWMEGERAPEAEAHLRGCGNCRELLADLEEIRVSGRALGEVEPPPRVWTAVRAQLEEEGLTRARGWRTWLPSFGMIWPRPAVAGATLAVLVAGAFLLGIEVRNYNNSQRWTQGTEAATRPIDTNLGNFELHEVSALHGPNQAVNASFQKNLQIVDKYIAMCEKSVREEPENELARDYLYGAYQQKADLLAEMSERGENPQ